MLKSETEDFDGLRVTTQQFAAMRAFTLFAKLAKVIGPAIGVLSRADQRADVMSIAPALSGAMQNLDPDAATALAADILAETTVYVNGTPLKMASTAAIDAAFMGRFATLFKVIAFAIKVNFGDFLGGSTLGAPPLPEPSAQ